MGVEPIPLDKKIKYSVPRNCGTIRWHITPPLFHFFAGRAAAEAEGATAAEAEVTGEAVSTTTGAAVAAAVTTAEGAAASTSTVFSEVTQPAKTTQQKITFFMLQSPIIAQLVRGGSNYNTRKNKITNFYLSLELRPFGRRNDGFFGSLLNSLFLFFSSFSSFER